MQKTLIKYGLPGIITLPYKFWSSGSSGRTDILPETISFLLSNLLYSASAYLVSFVIPYILNTSLMASFSSGMQLLLIISTLLELSISTSFTRFYQFDSSVRLYNSVLQMLVFAILAASGIVLSLQVFNIMGLENIGVTAETFVFIIIAQLSWMYIRSWLLATGKLDILLYHSILILVLRSAAVIYHMSRRQNDIESIFISTLLLPLIPSMIHLAYVNISVIISSVWIMRGARKEGKTASPFTLEKFIGFAKYSFMIHISGVLYLYTARYTILYLTGKNEQAVADMGYAMTFMGVILVFYSSFRNYILARLNMRNEYGIRKYLLKLGNFKALFITASAALTVILSFVVWIIRPEYLGVNSVLFSFVLFATNFLLFYFGMITLLSKTMGYNKMEFAVNLIRLIAVMFICNTVLHINLILGFALVNISIAGTEYIFSVYVRKKIKDAFSW